MWVLCVRSWSELDDLSTVAVDDCFHRNAPGEDSIIGRHTHFQHFPDDGAVAECAAQQVFRYLERLGHQRRLISCDQETALRSLVSEVARMRGGAVTPPEHSAVGGSQGHGFTECAVRTAEEMVRTASISQKLNLTLKVIPWLVEHSVDPVHKL